jgi:hypothetical protein
MVLETQNLSCLNTASKEFITVFHPRSHGKDIYGILSKMYGNDTHVKKKMPSPSDRQPFLDGKMTLDAFHSRDEFSVSVPLVYYGAN